MWREMQLDRPLESHRAGIGVRRAVAQFAVSGIAALILLGFAGVYLLRSVGREEAIRNAKQVTAVAAHGILEPMITPGLASGDPRAIALLDAAVRRDILDNRVVRVKIWRRDGKILYSDVQKLIGSSYPLGADEQSVLRRGGIAAEVSDLSRPENRFELRYGKLLEVYMRVRDPAGRPLMFESYQRYSSIAASGRKVWLAFAPAIALTLALLWIVQLPLAWRLARRLREGQLQRLLLLQRAIDASELERRRIARDLHDGAVQDLAGVSYSLTAAADTVTRSSPDETATAMRDAAAGTRRTIKQLRTLLVDIYPPDLHRTGIEAALKDLVAPLAPRGVEAAIDVPDGIQLTPALETLFYRCAQEAVRNVATHADAEHMTIRIEQDDDLARLIVEDDGRGFEQHGRDGHLGLRLLADLAGEAGGQLELTTAPRKGVRVCIEVPRG